ncbi:MAG: IclR family transcriptional regulator, acetate operon repressor [Streptosporangiaceae bacterium]|jgi:DNA-binding IclR family transcriptional regulator|nr:IclR family transcriptional regulator, acetate operon repressor [Streptosporangiaceae bacterium]
MADYGGDDHTTKAGSTVQSVERAAALLLALAEFPRGASLSELSAATGLHKSTARRLLLTLSAKALVRQVPPADHYTLGARVPALGQAAQRHLLLGPVTHRILVELRNETVETVHLATPDKFELVYLEKVQSHWAIQASSRIGARTPLYCTGLGKAYLAFQPREVWADYIDATELRRKTPTTLTDPAALIEELSKIRRNGYAWDNEENEPGVRCVGAPVLNSACISVAAISVMAPTARLPTARVAELGSQVKAAAARLAATTLPPDADAATLRPGSGHHDQAAEVTVIAPHQPPEGQGILAGSQTSPAEGQ